MRVVWDSKWPSQGSFCSGLKQGVNEVEEARVSPGCPCHDPVVRSNGASGIIVLDACHQPSLLCCGSNDDDIQLQASEGW